MRQPNKWHDYMQTSDRPRMATRINEAIATRESLQGKLISPHSARNGMGKIIKKQAQVGDSSVGRQEKRNLKYEDEEPTN